MNDIYIYHDHHQIPWNGIYRDLPYFFHTIGVAYGVRPGWPLVRGLAAATGRERWGEEPQTHVNPKWRQTNFVLIFLEWDVNYIYIYIYDYIIMYIYIYIIFYGYKFTDTSGQTLQ